MANLPVIGGPVTINTADNYVIGVGSEHSASTCFIEGTATAFTGTGLIVKGRKKGSTAAFVAIPYVRRFVAGAVSDDTVVSAALAATFAIKVDATGMQISLDNSAGYVSGSFAVEYQFVEGAAA